MTKKKNTTTALAQVDVNMVPVNLTFDKQDIVNIGIMELEQRLQAEFDTLSESYKSNLREYGVLAGELVKEITNTLTAEFAAGVLGKIAKSII
jgi:hypothetical protein